MLYFYLHHQLCNEVELNWRTQVEQIELNCIAELKYALSAACT